MLKRVILKEPATSGYCSPAALELPDDVPIPNFRHDHDVYNKYPSPLFKLMGNEIEDSSPTIPLPHQTQLRREELRDYTYIDAMSQHNTDVTDEEVCVESSTSNRRPIFKKRKQVDKTSLIWNHVKQLLDLKVTRCN